MTEGQLDQLSDLRHLFAASTDIIVANLIQVTLLIFSLNRLALSMDDGVLRNNAELWWIDLDNLEFNLPHATTHSEKVALPYRTVCFAEIWGEENVKERACKTLNSIGDGKNGNTLGLLGF